MCLPSSSSSSHLSSIMSLAFFPNLDYEGPNMSEQTPTESALECLITTITSDPSTSQLSERLDEFRPLKLAVAQRRSFFFIEPVDSYGRLAGPSRLPKVPLSRSPYLCREKALGWVLRRASRAGRTASKHIVWVHKTGWLSGTNADGAAARSYNLACGCQPILW